VGWTGKAIPVGHLEPVTISGAVITKGTLHNVKFIEDNNIFPNREVIVERSGGAGVKICRLAFPSLYSNNNNSNHNNNSTFSHSVEGTKYYCPCDKKYQLIAKGGDRYNLYCPDDGCKEKFCTLLEHFAGALNITGFGIGMIRDLIYYHIVKSIADLLSISQFKHKLVGLSGWGNIKIEKLVKSIDTAKKNARVADSLYSLSIPVCGKGMCETVSAKFPSLWELDRCSSPQEIMSRGINEQCSINLFQFFKELREGSQPFIGSSLQELHSAGLNVGDPL
jgi:DNA ligase (NAD+)